LPQLLFKYACHSLFALVHLSSATRFALNGFKRPDQIIRHQ